jgi:hypothetical protein
MLDLPLLLWLSGESRFYALQIFYFSFLEFSNPVFF